MTDRFDLNGKVAIVIGATKGMGATISAQFAASGARVVVNSRNQAEAEAFAAELNREHGDGAEIAAAQAGDMTREDDLRRVADTALAKFGKITTLVLSPTIRPWFGSAVDMPADEIDTQFLYVFKSRFWATRLCVPHMAKAGGGSVIYIGSGSAFEATSERSVYSCMRAAEAQMMRNFAAEFGQNNIRFNFISPGLIDSHGAQSLFADADTVRQIVAGMPMRRHGHKSEISNAATWLASDASSFTTGAVVPVDGGRNLHASPSRLTNAFAAEQAERLGTAAGTR
ncbi:MAG TPA: SDR family oxidoreductase [Amycolatopsis sp.]|nr:SDR family oxidoreductase [Amycolatopsis sp.]